jgi:hypothetical protein
VSIGIHKDPIPNWKKYIAAVYLICQDALIKNPSTTFKHEQIKVFFEWVTTMDELTLDS